MQNRYFPLHIVLLLFVVRSIRGTIPQEVGGYGHARVKGTDPSTRRRGVVNGGVICGRRINVSCGRCSG